MSEAAIPESVDQLREVVLASDRVLAIGQQTKPALSQSDAALISTRRLTGIVQYEPSEFTFTALAGTTVAEIAETLGQRGQYLPFDPMLVSAGATLGGTVASGLSGPGRFRYGGIRDFLLGVCFLSGEGEWIHAGGKVVKNAAGFDIPKFLVGSLGRYGVMTELTFKVFPRPVAESSLCVRCSSHQQALDRMSQAANSRWELFAIDYQPAQQTVLLRLGGPPESNEAIATEIRSLWGQDVGELAEADKVWRLIRELDFLDGAAVVKVPTSGRKMLELCQTLEGQSNVRLHVSLAGQLVWVAVSGDPSLRSLDTLLKSLGLSGLVVRGEGPCWIGVQRSSHMHQALKQAMDPSSRFPDLPIPAVAHSP